MRARVAVLVLLAAALVGAGAFLGRGGGAETPVPTTPSATASGATSPTASPSPAPPGGMTLVGAGDIAACDSPGAAATAALLDAIPGAVFAAGDNAYERGTAAEFADCYARTWGRHKARTRPAPGNHDYTTNGAAAYFAYFGDAAGEAGRGWYSYDLGAWHVVVLNSNCGSVGGCGPSSPQARWLDADLAAYPTRCALAIWHHPRFSSGDEHGNDPAYATFWDMLYERGVDVVINAHDHDYERFAPQTPDGLRNDALGVREFVVGTGGASLRRAGRPIANSEVLRDDAFGVLRLTLRAVGYDWQFVPVAGSTLTDSGSGTCH